MCSKLLVFEERRKSINLNFQAKRLQRTIKIFLRAVFNKRAIMVVACVCPCPKELQPANDEIRNSDTAFLLWDGPNRKFLQLATFFSAHNTFQLEMLVEIEIK